jgi:hypothetical protein
MFYGRSIYGINNVIEGSEKSIILLNFTNFLNGVAQNVHDHEFFLYTVKEELETIYPT